MFLLKVVYCPRQLSTANNKRTLSSDFTLSPQGRLLSDCIAVAEARGSAVTLDEGFMEDVEEEDGVPLVKGTRIPADQLVEEYQLGSPIEEIVENYELPDDKVRRIIAFAQRG